MLYHYLVHLDKNGFSIYSLINYYLYYFLFAFFFWPYFIIISKIAANFVLRFFGLHNACLIYISILLFKQNFNNTFLNFITIYINIKIY